MDLATWNREHGARQPPGVRHRERRAARTSRWAGRDLEAIEELLPGWLARLITRRIPFTDAAQALDRSPDDIKTVLDFD